ncbi:amidohydrolase family protein [Proteobacteria bacterium 005FR1]|nr:amidohydrolase family protein [Proteobacteria bacterium 005FR1]
MKYARAKTFRMTILLALVAAGGWLWHEVSDLPAVLEPAPNDRPDGVLIDNVRLISMRPDAPEADPARAVLVRGDRIVSVAAAGSLQTSDDVLVVNGRGRTLMPGLIDAHVHLNDEAELAAYLAHGITGLRNMSGYPFHLPLAEKIRSGSIIGPDLITTGPILNSHGPNENLIQQIVTTAAEARAAVQKQHGAGYRAIKVYSNLTREAFNAAVQEADRLGMSVTGHSPEGVRSPGIPYEKEFDIPWTQSLGRNFTTLEHVETIVWHSLRDNLDEAAMRQVAAEIAASGETVTPTLIAHARLVRIAETKGAYLDRPGSDTINPLVRFFEKGSEEYWSRLDPAAYERPHADFFVTATGLLHEAGVPLIVGTDAGGFGLIPGASMTRELELLVEAGLSAHEALEAATRVSAEALGFSRTGVVAPGYRANLVLLSDNPLERIESVEFPDGVMIAGDWLEGSRLQAMKEGARETSFFRSLWRVLQMKLHQ